MTIMLLAAGAVMAVAPTPHYTPARLDSGADAAAALALRVLGPRAPTLFSFATLPSGSCELLGPCAIVKSSTTAEAVVHIAGSSPVEMAYALAHYCRTALNMSFS